MTSRTRAAAVSLQSSRKVDPKRERCARGRSDLQKSWQVRRPGAIAQTTP